jgi:hypothetical protein
MMRDMAEDGAAVVAHARAEGHQGRPAHPALRRRYHGGSSTATSAHWEANARHALAQEKGGRPHEQTGWVNFFWEKEGRDWEPGPNRIHHPGNPAHPYLRPAYEIIMGRWMEYARRYYPAMAAPETEARNALIDMLAAEFAAEGFPIKDDKLHGPSGSRRHHPGCLSGSHRFLRARPPM